MQRQVLTGVVLAGFVTLAAEATSGDASSSTPGDPSFNSNNCFKWFGQIALQMALNQHECVEVQEGTYVLDKGVGMKPGRTLRGVSPSTSVLKANASNWNFGCCDGMISDTQPGVPEQNPFHIATLTLDGSGVATYNVCCSGYLVEELVLKDSRYSAIGAAGKGVTAKNNQLLNSGQPTNVPGRGVINCATGGFGGVEEAAAIYSEARAVNFGTVIEGNSIQRSYGPALDVNGAWGGVFRKNVVADNRFWAAVSLYGASGWVIEDNQISHPADEPPQRYHPYCATGPNDGRAAGIFLCQDTDVNNLVTNGNIIRHNKSSSYYGILSVGYDEEEEGGQPYWAPRNNFFSGNDVSGSVVGCADDFRPRQWLDDANIWINNNCTGSPNTPPLYY